MPRLAVRLVFAAIVLLFVSAPIYAGNGAAVEKVDDFTLTDYNGKQHRLSDYKDAKAVVLIFVSTQCPVSNAYNERMAKLHEDFKERGVAFLGINANVAEDVSNIKKHAAENKLPFVILKDKDNLIADKLEASVTPEVYIVNAKHEVLYHGRIDDSRNAEKVTSQDTRKALEEILAGKEVSEARTKAFGCSIKRVAKEAKKASS